MRFLRVLVLAGLGALVFGQDMSRMETYYLVLLRKGPAAATQNTEEIRRLQEAHLANIRRLSKEGKMILAGPFMDGGDLRGLFLLRVKSLEEAKALCDTDPAIQAGRLVAEIHTWLSVKGIRAPE